MPWVEAERSAKPNAPSTASLSSKLKSVFRSKTKEEKDATFQSSLSSNVSQHVPPEVTGSAEPSDSSFGSLDEITLSPETPVSNGQLPTQPTPAQALIAVVPTVTKSDDCTKEKSSNSKLWEKSLGSLSRPAGSSSDHRGSISGSVESAKRIISDRVLERVGMHRRELHENKPEVALLLPADVSLPDRLHLCASASLLFHGEPARLWVLQLAISEQETAQEAAKVNSVWQKTPADQLMEIDEVLQKLHHTCEERGERLFFKNTQPWPLHEHRVTEALLARESEVLGLESGSWFGGTFTRILHAARILSPDEDGPVLNAFRDQYGPSAAFTSVWGFFFVQALWMLLPIVILFLFLECRPAASGTDRIKFEIVKGSIIIWGAVISILCSTRFLGDDAVKQRERKKLKRSRSSSVTTTPSKISKMSKAKRMLLLIFVALPLLALLGSFSLFALGGVTNLILHVIYVWGDCYNLHKPCPDPSRPLDCKEICRDAEKKHGIFGWAAEVGCDVFLAIIFELLFSLSSALSDFVSELLSFEFETHRRYFKSMLQVSLAGLERIGFVFSLAFFFVPQWSSSYSSSHIIDMSISCSDLPLGESDYACFQRRLPVELRRALLEKLMKGPFMVAPFISILVKTIIPYVIYKLSQACDYLMKCPGRCFPCLPLRFIVRFFTLVFTLEGSNAGCSEFVCQGWPFSEVAVDPAPEGPEKQPLKEYKKGIVSVLEQSVLKPFEADDELLELQMSFLWVLFFTPLRPEGVITTLIAKVAEIYFDWVKMLHVRRRSFPESDKVMRRTQAAFVNAVVIASFGWTLGISLITYNDNLYEWGTGGNCIFIAMCLWLVFCAALGFSRTTSLGCALGYAVFVDYRKQHKKEPFNELR